MSPYRNTPAPLGARELRLAAPLSAEGVLLAAAIFTPLLLAAYVSESVIGACLVAAGFLLVVSLVLLCRHRAWIVMMPLEERVRVVRLRGFSYSAATLRLSESMSVECSPVGKTMWLFVVAKDGRAARVIPSASARMMTRVQHALEDAVRSSDTRRGTPSPR